jgi:hypothetical protein
MLFTGASSFYTGAPGAVMAYVALSALLLMGDKISSAFYTKFLGWSLVIISLLQFQPTFWTGDGIQSLFTGSMDSASFISAIPTYLSSIVVAHVVAINILLLLIPILLGVLLILRPNRIVALVTLVFLMLVWWLGQDFGQLSTLITGVCTDPNMAPLLALFIIPAFLQRRSVHHVLTTANQE